MPFVRPVRQEQQERKFPSTVVAFLSVFLFYYSSFEIWIPAGHGIPPFLQLFHVVPP